MKNILYILLIIIISSCSNERITDFEKYDMFPKVIEVSNFYKIKLDLTGKSETLETTKWIHGPLSIEYKYEGTNDTNFRELFYAITVTIENNLSDAHECYNVTVSEFKILSKPVTETKLKEFQQTLDTDKQYYYSVRYINGKPNGLMFVILDGKVTYSIVLSGLFSEEDNLKFVEKMILPRLNKLGTLKIYN